MAGLCSGAVMAAAAGAVTTSTISSVSSIASINGSSGSDSRQSRNLLTRPITPGCSAAAAAASTCSSCSAWPTSPLSSRRKNAVLIGRREGSTAANVSRKGNFNGEATIAIASLHSSDARRSSVNARVGVQCNATQQSNDSATSSVAETGAVSKPQEAAPSPVSTSTSATTATSPLRRILGAKPREEKTTESFQELMSFSGSAPEIINGRLAMIGFFGSALAEKISGLTFVEQVARAPGSVLSWMVLISFASIVPKYIAEVPLSELLYAARKDGMPEQLKLANVDVERAVGRTAMLGFLGTVLVELVCGGVFNGSFKLPF